MVKTEQSQIKKMSYIIRFAPLTVLPIKLFKRIGHIDFK
jgi:hypothetical protein